MIMPKLFVLEQILKFKTKFPYTCSSTTQEHQINYFLIFQNKVYIQTSISPQSSKLTSKTKSQNKIQVYDLFKIFLQTLT